jgi:hypothetical protein
VPSCKHCGGFRPRGHRVGGAGGGWIGGVGGGGDEGAVEVREDEAARGALVGRDDLADAVCGGLALHAGEEGDGVGELRLRGAVLRGAREVAEPRGDGGLGGASSRRRRRRRHRRAEARVLGAGDGERRGGAFVGFGGEGNGGTEAWPLWASREGLPAKTVLWCGNLFLLNGWCGNPAGGRCGRRVDSSRVCGRLPGPRRSGGRHVDARLGVSGHQCAIARFALAALPITVRYAMAIACNCSAKTWFAWLCSESW